MARRSRDRQFADLLGAHLLALSKATAVYQAELARIYLGLEEEEEETEAGPLYKAVRDLERVGFASSMVDPSAGGPERRLRSWQGAQAALAEQWIELLGRPWRDMLASLEASRSEDDDE